MILVHIELWRYRPSLNCKHTELRWITYALKSSQSAKKTWALGSGLIGLSREVSSQAKDLERFKPNHRWHHHLEWNVHFLVGWLQTIPLAGQTIETWFLAMPVQQTYFKHLQTALARPGETSRVQDRGFLIRRTSPSTVTSSAWSMWTLCGALRRMMMTFSTPCKLTLGWCPPWSSMVLERSWGWKERSKLGHIVVLMVDWVILMVRKSLIRFVLGWEQQKGREHTNQVLSMQNCRPFTTKEVRIPFDYMMRVIVPTLLCICGITGSSFCFHFHHLPSNRTVFLCFIMCCFYF